MAMLHTGKALIVLRCCSPDHLDVDCLHFRVS